MKKDLLNEKYVQGHINGVGSNYLKFEFDEEAKGKSVNEIASLINTEKAVDFLQSGIENYQNYCLNQGISCDKLPIDLYAEFFMNKKVADSADEEYKIEGVRLSNFLENVVYVSPSVEVLDKNKNSHELEKFQDAGFIVNYNEFASRLEALGYELNYQDYEQLLAGEILERQLSFDAPITPETKKTK